jgi:hypothetical protein
MIDLRQRSLRLGDPEGHLHTTVHLDGGGQFGTALLTSTKLGIQGTETVVAMGKQWAHAKFFSQSEGLSVVDFGFFYMRWIALRRDVAEEAQGIRLVTAFLVFTGERQRVLGEGVRLLQAASPQMRLPQGETTEGLKYYYFRCSRLFHRLREQRHGITDAPAQSVRRSQGRSHPGEIGREVRFLADAYGTFE